MFNLSCCIDVDHVLQVLFLRGDGFLALGHSLEDAFQVGRALIQASEQQVMMAVSGAPFWPKRLHAVCALTSLARLRTPLTPSIALIEMAACLCAST